MTKSKSIEAQERLRLKQAAARQDREGLANLATAAVTAKVAGGFVDIDFAIGLMAQAATLSPAKKEKLAEAGRTIRLDLLPTISEDGAAVDLVARLPADVADASDLARRLVSLGLRSNRRRGAALFIEFAGPSDEAAVRAVVEPVGGRVTVIASPPTAAVAGMGTDEPGPVAGSSSTEEMMEAPPTDGAIGTGTVEPATHPDELPPDPAALFAPQDAPNSFFSSHRLRPTPLMGDLGSAEARPGSGRRDRHRARRRAGGCRRCGGDASGSRYPAGARSRSGHRTAFGPATRDAIGHRHVVRGAQGAHRRPAGTARAAS